MSHSFHNVLLPRWGIMWGLALSIFAAVKLLTWLLRQSNGAAPWKHAAYLVGWPGMDVNAFLFRRDVKCPEVVDWAFACFKLAAGIVVLLGVVPLLNGRSAYLIGWVGMGGIVFALHFGMFDVLSCVWRSLGAYAVPIMNWPILATGPTQFWGMRWNLAFRDLTHQFLFRPLVRFVGPIGALLIGFFVSGLVHDLIISVPAGGGYGLPTCYFLIQAAAVLVERSRLGRALRLGRGTGGWLFCAAAVVLPSPLLFHQPFIDRVMVPFLQAMGAVR